MLTQTTRVARIDRPELTDLPPAWTDRDRGLYLRLLLQMKGIDPARFYRVAYYPLARCWLLTQEPAPGPGDKPAAVPRDDVFYRQVIDQFRWTARSACAALAAHSSQFALFGCKYQLPAKPQELTPADLVHQLGGPGSKPGLYFTSEGGWRLRSSEN
jgi:hypothetical protein